METAKSDVEKLTMNGFLIVCSRTNDIDRNYSSNAFKIINNFIKSVNHINIILISVPYRRDVTDYPRVNNMIKSFNSKLLTLAKKFSPVGVIEIVKNRLLFTKHGLHLNESGPLLFLLYRVSQELRSLLQDLIPELILNQKRHIHMGLIGNGSGVMNF